ncbi:hypothetical protein A3C20_03025 [Candidatus Kaiserbacteria bacterium RIFCSPHIGHO2_02_FULL_55_25]|uniref:Cohesin domain-containing protein n=1 Tax=Candidatus Kaiserbacteria bacterium RIFCSPHIGHO2_02_FULL_55_25 TaxID=1798498 RepID=A0A1F6E6E1_9BACT|nr:MAG: hypothetical protein A2764_03520 [Candidatus Kaiserbacteria bacterium RIFCSPHIGHO2_01_FULL_55_79]OGG69238.1 MAG: hypothetical protein A3C20_03025 [Candidatus Kaiserbacteria bacterium RIFCSPHIGHO2_02_FULL_55_25]OGG78670.1 MAG: hypothetical protein A3F56_03540 [Candidatus Kaiserbacteria bacterium RIFCSPHIGHO2_12_FULL_55_13]OGG83871.1 MAG: hypothetical protein A3A42_00025 [Candidatus Kaiserbacteria bacterium RIFCSPLOWO2_01_FULL_55_25]
MIVGHATKATITLFAIAGLALPVFASAATVSGLVSPTQQLLPRGANTCAPLQVQSVNPYIYNNNLDSFDVTITDPSYVSVIGSVGNTGIPLSFMTRRMNADGTLRIHVDIQSTPVNGILPVSLTLLSAPSGKPVCVSVVSFTLTGPAKPVKITPVTTTSVAPEPAPVTNNEETSEEATTSPFVTASPVVGGGLQSSLTKACEAAGPYQLWFILLALFMVVIGLVAFAEPPLGNKGPGVPLAAILVPLVLLLGFWYLAPLCRVAGWIPVVLIVAAAIGLVTAFRDQEMPLVKKAIQLPEAKPPMKQPVTTFEKNSVPAATIITPPPVKK